MAARLRKTVAYLGTWCAMLLVSIANGALRDLSYGPHMTELAAHQLSTLSSILLLGAVMWLALRRWPPASAVRALATGLGWMSMTMAFEFLFFHYVGGHPWSVLLANYNVLAGRVWVVVLLWVALAPWLFHHMRRAA